ncbi:hypothetical protein ACFYO0_29365 [Streptomyces sp. NPDC006365]|uniref:hypothetical protein n=1 Tax=Streptomyces sp. NPDC006365 TaxID=3364744 RepID=UPI0036AEB288
MSWRQDRVAAHHHQGDRRLERGPAAQFLQIERDDELEAEEGTDEEQRAEIGPYDGCLAQDAQAYEGRGAAAFDDDERGGEECGGDCRPGRQLPAVQAVFESYDGLRGEQHGSGGGTPGGDRGGPAGV